ncbi:MAG: SDR family oxidoreductase [Aureibaculum sp.]
MKKKVLITGSNGLLGQKLVNLFTNSKDYEVIAVSLGKDRNNTAKNYTYYNIDITNVVGITEIIDQLQPDYIINCAAMTNVDDCERHKDKCDLINVKAVETLVSCAKKNNIHLVHISTDFVFDGKKGPYLEDDEPNPINYYGLSKLRSEELIVSAGIKYSILRTILVYGIVDNMNKSNIVLFVINSLENKKQITMVDDQFRMPTLADDLAEACQLAIQHQAYGIFHISSNELLSIYEMSLQIADTFKLDASYISRIPTSQLDQPARRPSKTGFILDKSEKVLKFKGLPFKNRLQVFKNQLLNFDS